MTDWMQALRGEVVAIVAGLTCSNRPVDQSATAVVTHFLFALFQLLLTQLRPGEAQIARRWHQPEADRTTLRQKHALSEPVALLALEQPRDRFVREVTGRDHVRRRNTELSAAPPRLRQVNLQERAKAVEKLGEWVDGLDGSSTVGPARAGARRQRDHKDLAAFERCAPGVLVGGAERSSLHDVTWAHVLDRRVGR